MFPPAKSWILGLSLSVFWSSSLFAESIPPAIPPSPVTVQMAAPPMEGTVSIGVFSESGQCIRVLYKNVPSAKIPSALNGFSVTWDGRTGGSVAVNGKYEIRGMVVGAIEVEGVAYHFNDWIDPDKAANPPIQTQRIALLEGGKFVAVQELADHQLALLRYSAEGKLEWSQPLPAPVSGLAVTSAGAWLASEGSISAIDLESGRLEKWTESYPGLKILTAKSSEIFATMGNRLFTLDPSTHQMKLVATLPSEIQLLAARGDLLLVSDGTAIYQLVGDHSEKLGLALPGRVLALEIGKPGEFWVVGEPNTLTEFNLQGEALRNLEPENGETFLDVAATAEDTRLAVISRLLPGERTRLLELAAAPTGNVSLWKTRLLREIQPVENFGVDPQTLRPVARGSLPTEKSVSVSLVENPLSPGKTKAQVVKSASLEGGTWVVTADGLPLFPVVTASKSDRHVLLRSKKARELTLFAATEGAVAEFSLRGLENMMEFSSDPIQWPAGPKQKADEDRVPEKAPAPTPE